MDKKALFVTLPFSHYCEKARWAMDRVGFLYHEETHLPGFHILANALRGTGAAVPYFKIGSFVVQDSTDILQYIDAAVSATSRLYPSEPALRRECDDLEELCDTKLGPATRQLWFFHVLRDRDYSLRVMRLSGPRLERMLIPLAFSTVRDKISRKYDINAAGATCSRLQTDQVFSAVSDRLSDGRKYLLGEMFSAADIAFAALAAPVINPPEFSSLMPTLEEAPQELATIINEFRLTPAGAFALRLYREERRCAIAQ